MAEFPASTSRWPAWLLAISVVLGIPLVYNALLGVATMPHSSEAIAVLLTVLIGAMVVAIWAAVGIVVLIVKPAQRTFIGYSAVVLALAVCSLVFVPGGLLR
jgi:hypothetical protein